jgi:hypothetical protein
MNGQVTITVTWSQIPTLIAAFFAVMGAFTGAFTYHIDCCCNRLRSEMNKGFDAIDKRLDALIRASAQGNEPRV